MKLLTRGGVCYDFTKTPFTVKVDGVTFKFSSRLYMNKFTEKLEENREIVNYSSTRRYGFKVVTNGIADVLLYRKIEKRGFLIVDADGNEITPETLKFEGGNLCLK